LKSFLSYITLAAAFHALPITASSGREREQDETFLNGTFPLDFLWGVATSSYQIEGGWNAGGKGENIWDNFTHRAVSPIADGSTGDIACDSYNKYMADIEILKGMNVWKIINNEFTKIKNLVMENLVIFRWISTDFLFPGQE